MAPSGVEVRWRWYFDAFTFLLLPENSHWKCTTHPTYRMYFDLFIYVRKDRFLTSRFRLLETTYFGCLKYKSKVNSIEFEATWSMYLSVDCGLTYPVFALPRSTRCPVHRESQTHIFQNASPATWLDGVRAGWEETSRVADAHLVCGIWSERCILFPERLAAVCSGLLLRKRRTKLSLVEAATEVSSPPLPGSARRRVAHRHRV